VNINKTILANIRSAHGTAAEQNVANWFKQLGSVFFQAESPVPEYGTWASGMLFGMQMFLRMQGHDAMTALKIQEYIWGVWPYLAREEGIG
jgi:hypothetical protein